MLQIRYIEDIYCDYLYDCYQANKHLSPDDWMWFGRELHHIEIPNCEGGTLGPLNEQYLTTYQHWIAGVLQSEMLGYCCFAFVPKEILPGWIETLRLKWCAVSNRQNTILRESRRQRLPDFMLADKIPYAKRKPTPRSEKISKTRGVPILLTLPGGQVLRYDSIKLACRVHSLHPGHLREVAQGKRNHHKGFTARYA
jgi:hypothetical protein